MTNGPPRGWRGLLAIIGPGAVVAATGVGAGDLVAAAKAGATFGLPVLWAAAFGAVLKFVLAEGVARWQLATGTTLLEGWLDRFGRPFAWWFLTYLVLWTLIVAAALMSACGLAAHALFPAIPVAGWGVIHALAAFAFVWFEGYGVFERAMKWAIGLMFVTIVGSALLQPPPVGEALRGLAITVPPGSTVLLLGVVGGVGGTLTLLSYNYWMQEKGWRGAGWIRAVRADLGVGYALTGVFGVALTLLAATVLHPQGIRIEGSQGVLALAQVLGQRFGGLGEKVFLVGFWGAVATSVLGVWQGVPYLFADFVDKLRSGENVGVATRGKIYRGYLAFLTFPPMLILALGKPVWVVVVYAAVGSLFMPVLAATLLVLNNRRSHGTLRNGWATNLALVLCLALFAFLAWQELRAKLG